MPEFKSGLNPFSPENLSTSETVLIVFLVLGLLVVLVILTDKVIVSRLNPENRFVKWWKKHIMDFNPFEK
jgi:hypothetical protein